MPGPMDLSHGAKRRLTPEPRRRDDHTCDRRVAAGAPVRMDPRSQRCGIVDVPQASRRRCDRAMTSLDEHAPLTTVLERNCWGVVSRLELRIEGRQGTGYGVCTNLQTSCILRGVCTNLHTRFAESRLGSGADRNARFSPTATRPRLCPARAKTAFLG